MFIYTITVALLFSLNTLAVTTGPVTDLYVVNDDIAPDGFSRP